MVPSDPFDHPLLLAPALQMVGAIPLSVLWVVGDTWVRCEHGEYFTGADNLATHAQIHELLIKANWDAHQWAEE